MRRAATTLVLAAVAVPLLTLGGTSPAVPEPVRTAQPRVVVAPSPPAPIADRGQRRALHLAATWLATYPRHLWVGLELPGQCERRSGGRRSCPIGIELRAWTDGVLVPWRCQARAILPRPGSAAAPRRTSAHCHRLPGPVLRPQDPRRS